MAFTYLGTLSTNLDKVRYYIQDTVESSGPKPNDANFTDAELTALVTVEGSWQRAVAAAYEILAAAWTRFTSFSADGLRLDRSDTAKGYAAQAAVWRKRHGQSTPAAGSRGVTRIDGYSDDVANTEV